MPVGIRQIYPKRENLRGVCGCEIPEGVRKMVVCVGKWLKSNEKVTRRCTRKIISLVRTQACEEIDDGLESAGDSDFAEDVLKMCFDGVAREAKLVRHLLVRLAENQQIDDFLLPLSQVQLREVRGGQRQGCCLTATQTGQDDRMQVGQIGRSDFHASVSRADDLHEFLRGGILDDVSHSPGLDPVKDALIVGIGR